MTNFDFLRQRLLTRAGIIEQPKPPLAGLSFEQLRKECCDPRFLEYMDNRLVMGRLRYGNAKRKLPRYYFFTRIKRELDGYLNTGNTEFLVNAANYARLEFENSQHPNAHFHAVDRS